MRILITLALSLGLVVDAEASLQQAPEIQPLGYGGGLEWSLPVSEGCSLYVREYGDRSLPTRVVLHGGWGAEHSYLLDAFVGLEQHFHLVFYDQRGSLRSWNCETESISVSSHVQDLERLRMALGLERLNMFAHSMGAVLAGAYQREFPQRTGRLVLVSPGLPKLPLETHEIALYEPLIEDWDVDDYSPFDFFNTLGDRLQMRPEVQAELKRHGLDSDELTPREESQRWRLLFAAANLYRVDRWSMLRGGGAYFNAKAGQAAAMSLDALAPWNFVEKWREHPHPVTVIIGDHDFVDWRAALNRHWFENDGHVRLFVIDQAGHIPWLDRPETFREALVQGLRED